ncbi:MAG: elongation factor 4 [Desulfococcus sp. 4484_241]|nr:MAG: elongation factor 4 [Desulfococcus sp. 4484_241]
MEHIRNFCIIAHIDHGKSTLSDRLIQASGIIPPRELRAQLLDTMDLERERGITIKSQTICLPYRTRDGILYNLNLIDTPGHVDFSYEVSRAIASCEGAIDHDLEILPVINKIDLASADVDRVMEQIEDDLGLDASSAIMVSAKENIGIEELLSGITEKLPPPKGDPDAPLRALIFDATYDDFRGTVVHVRIFEGCVKPGDMIMLMSNRRTYKVEEVGVFQLERKPKNELSAGEVGYIIAGIKSLGDTRCGDTVTLKERQCDSPMPGFREAKPVVFSSIFPIGSDDYEELYTAIEKLKLNDASLVYEKTSSLALGFGFRCGFLGLLHLEIVQERLEREYGQSLIITAPTVRYEVITVDGKSMFVDNPEDYPEPEKIQLTREPFIKASIIVPDRYMGAVMNLCMERRGVSSTYHYLTGGRMEMLFELPLAEVMYDFYDRLKTVTQGYGSFDYEMLDYRESDLVKLDILVNGERVDALSQLVHRDKAVERARHACRKLAEEIPRQMFKIPIQGAIGGKIIARETISALRKDVTAKCYGGDITRKRKLLEKQKRGKKRMKTIGKVAIPQSAFLAVLKTDQ